MTRNPGLDDDLAAGPGWPRGWGNTYVKSVTCRRRRQAAKLGGPAGGRGQAGGGGQSRKPKPRPNY